MVKTEADKVYAAFMADICADPSDDVPRLILADWLEDHGAAKHAQFIRLQIEAYNLECDDHLEVPGVVCECRRCLLLTRAAAIVSVNTKEGLRRKLWAGKLSQFWELTFDYERGFVAQVNCRAALWGNWGNLIVSNQPVTRLRFSSYDIADSAPWATAQLLDAAQASEAALSNAAIAWARELAKLPPLKE